MSKNPLKAIFDIKKDELPFTILMSLYFFLVITSFWILKPIKKAIFIQYYDQIGFDLFNWHMLASQAELLAKVLNMIVAYAAVVVFSLLVRRFARQQLTYVFSLFFIFSYIIYSQFINSPTDTTVWTFYLFGDLFSTLMVATFFAFLNDSVSSDAAKRSYGLIGFGGVFGGVFGSSFLLAKIEVISNSNWLMICLGIAVVIIVVANFAGRLVNQKALQEKVVEVSKTVETKNENPALEGAKLVFRSPYLLSIVGIVGLYEMVSTIMDFQFTETISHYLDGDAIKRQFATAFTITNWTAMFVQLFLTSFVMTRFGVGIALLFLPFAALSWSIGYLMFPILWIGTTLNTADNGFSYSINQSAKEALYVPTTKDEKYKAKAFIDMFVQRFGKVVAVGLSLIITTIFTAFGAFRWLSLLTATILVVWIIAARYAGKRFEILSTELKEYIK
ncbi:MAG: NTP/NDP exchange transporter [bacterium]